jgi:DNA processing protein
VTSNRILGRGDTTEPAEPAEARHLEPVGPTPRGEPAGPGSEQLTIGIGADLDADRRARLILSQLAEPGDPELCGLVATVGAAAALASIERGEPARAADWLVRRPAVDLDHTMAVADRVGARFVTPSDEEWPTQLADLRHIEPRDRRGGEPLGLWMRGALSLHAVTDVAVAIVGSRAATDYGSFVAHSLAEQCSELGCHVVSGGAYGIDAAAHRGALNARRPTVAVLAGGVDRLYPRGNHALLERIAGDGLVVSEAPLGADPLRTRFLSRNRIIAALGRGTVVVEAALRSGALNTVRWAAELGRETMGVPGPVTSTSSCGVHQFIREAGAIVVTCGSEIVEQISTIGEQLTAHRSGRPDPRDGLELLSRQILDALPGTGAVTTEQVAMATGTRRRLVADRLLVLARNGMVQSTEGGWSLVAGT